MGLIMKVRDAGYYIDIAGDQIRIKSNQKLNEIQRNFIRSHKAELLAELRAEQALASVMSMVIDKPVTSAVYTYRTTEKPEALLTMVTQGKTLDEARDILDNRYGDKLLSVEPMQLQP